MNPHAENNKDEQYSFQDDEKTVKHKLFLVLYTFQHIFLATGPVMLAMTIVQYVGMILLPLVISSHSKYWEPVGLRTALESFACALVDPLQFLINYDAVHIILLSCVIVYIFLTVIIVSLGVRNDSVSSDRVYLCTLSAVCFFLATGFFIPTISSPRATMDRRIVRCVGLSTFRSVHVWR